MSDSCKCFNIEVEVILDEPEITAELDFDGEVILCSDGEDYKRGYEEGHAKGLADGQKVGYENGYNEGQIDGHKSGYEAGKTEGLTEGYDNGYEKGKTDGYKDGYEEGYSKGYEQGLIDGAKEEQEKSITITENDTIVVTPDDNKVLSKVTVDVNVADRWYNILWDNFQLNGERDNYNCAFYDYCTPNCWNSSILYPKYDIKGTNFANCFRDVKGELDLIERLKELNVILDTSKATLFSSMFRGCSGLTTVPTIDFSSCDITLTGSSAGAYFMFYDCSKLHTIEKIVSKAGVTYNNTFQNCSALREVRFDGVINQSISFAKSPLLTTETVDSVSVCLDDLTEQTAQTLTVHKDVFERMSDELKAFITSKNWTLVSSK